jgi:hypothetical protein
LRKIAGFFLEKKTSFLKKGLISRKSARRKIVQAKKVGFCHKGTGIPRWPLSRLRRTTEPSEKTWPFFPKKDHDFPSIAALCFL